jgi:cytochrome P450
VRQPSAFSDHCTVPLAFFPFVVAKMKEIFGIDLITSDSKRFYRNALEQLYAQRRNDPQASEKYNDILQLLLNAVDESEKASTEQIKSEDAEIFHEAIEKYGKANKHISKIEVISQCFLLLLAGYETTASTLHYALFHLAKLPEIQTRVQNEIDEVVGDSEHITYDHLSKLKYTSQVIDETHRICPLPRINRECTKPITLNGIHFEKGFSFTVPIYAIHHNPKYYPRPDKFDPERFSPEERAKRDPLTYLPFGYGPRNCVGMRLADTEIRIALAILLRKYTFYPAKESPDLPLKIEVNGFVVAPEKPLFLTAERR